MFVFYFIVVMKIGNIAIYILNMIHAFLLILIVGLMSVFSFFDRRRK